MDDPLYVELMEAYHVALDRGYAACWSDLSDNFKV